MVDSIQVVRYPRTGNARKLDARASLTPLGVRRFEVFTRLMSDVPPHCVLVLSQ